MSSQLFKEQVPYSVLADFLDNNCENEGKFHIFSKVCFSESPISQSHKVILSKSFEVLSSIKKILRRSRYELHPIHDGTPPTM